MRIMVLTNSMNSLYLLRKEKFEHFINMGYEIVISAPDNSHIDFFEKIGCSFVSTKLNRRGKNVIQDILLFIHYLKILKHYNPDIVLTYSIKSNIYGGIASRLRKIPYISNITGLGSAVENRGILQRISLALYKIAMKDVACLFFQNIENQTFMHKHSIALQNYRLIPGSGVNLKEFQPLAYPDENEINFLYIGRVMKEKGIEQYIEVAQHIKSKYPNTCFHVIGSCEEEYEELLEKLTSEGRIKYHGYQEGVREFHRISHCTIHPTYYPEGMSNTLLESAACARPVITTNRSGCREVVEDGLNGFLVPPKDLHSLIKAVEDFIALDFEKKRKMGIYGRNIVVKLFDREDVISSYMNEIKKIKVRQLNAKPIVEKRDEP